MAKIGLYFGSFNPIHNGHISIASYVLGHVDIEEVWFVLSPQNPFKDTTELLPFDDRAELVDCAIECDYRMKLCDIEKNLPTPSYTVDTLSKLPEHNEYAIIMGGDEFLTLDKWKNFEEIVAKYDILVVPRLDSLYTIGDMLSKYHSQRTNLHEKVHTTHSILLLNTPYNSISSSFIRNAIRKGRPILGYVPKEVQSKILEKDYYNKWLK